MSNKYIKNNGNGNFRVTVPFEINTYNSWSITTKIVTPEIFENCTLINTVDFDGNDIKSFKLDLNNAGHLTLCLSTDGNTYDYNLLSSNALEPNNQAYYIEVAWSGTMYTVKVSTNNINWVTFIQQDSTSILYSNLVYIDFIPTIDSTYFSGKLNISATKLIKRASGDSYNVVIFSGDTASNIGYVNHGVTINNGIASDFDTDKYIVCNGIDLSDYVKIITKVHVNSYQNKVNHPIVTNLNRQGIFVNNDGLGLSLTTDGREITGRYNQIILGKDYYIGYIFQLDNGVYKHSLYYLQDDGYYNDYTKLPDFNDTCIKPWTLGISVDSDENIFKNLIYLGSNKTYYLDGTIDVSNTIISNNIVTYNVSNPRLTEIKSPATRCYIPEVGTKIINSQGESIEGITLEPMVKFSINAQDSDEQYPIDLTNATISYSVTNSNYGTNTVYYYKQTTDKTTIYVLPGSNVTYSISNVVAYANASKTISNVTNDTIDTIDLTCNLYYTFTITVRNYMNIDVTANSTFVLKSGITTSSTNTIQVKYGRTVSYEVSKSDCYPVQGTTANLYESTAMTIKLVQKVYSLYYNMLDDLGYPSFNIISSSADVEKTFLSKYHNGCYILNNRLYKCSIDQNGGPVITELPLESRTSRNYASDWTFIGYNCAIRDGKVYDILEISSSSPYVQQVNSPYLDQSKTYINAYMYSNTGAFISALTNDGKLYNNASGQSTLIASNVTKMYGAAGVSFSYAVYGYYVNNTGLHCYDYSGNDTQLNSGTNWTVLTKNFGICDGKLYWISGTTISQLGTDTDWSEVGYDHYIRYSNNAWSNAYVFAIKGGNIVKVQLSGSETTPTLNVTNLTQNAQYHPYGKLSYGYVGSTSSSSSYNDSSAVFVAYDSNATSAYTNIIRSNDTVNYYYSPGGVVDLKGHCYTNYNKSTNKYDSVEIVLQLS